MPSRPVFPGLPTPVPRINPIQVPQQEQPFDIMGQVGALAQARPPITVGQPAARPPVSVQSPPPVQIQPPKAGLSPDQDALLKMAMAQAANPMPTMAGGTQTSTRVNMPGASSYLAQPGAPPTHTMDIFNGANRSTLTFGGPNNDILSQQDMTPMSPEDITRRMAGQLAPTEEQRALGMKLYEDMLKNRADLLRTHAETQNVQGRLDLDRQTQLGDLAMRQQQHGLDVKGKEFVLGAGKVLSDTQQKWRTDGVSEAEIARRTQQWIERNGIQSAMGGSPYGGALPGGQKLGPPPSTTGGGTPPPGTAAPPPSNLPIYAPIEGTLNEFSREASPDGGTTLGQRRAIGDFLMKLDAAHPGFVKQNWPMIEAYIKSQTDQGWGQKGLAETIQKPVRGSWWDAIPVISSGTAIADLIANPRSRESWQNWAQIPLGMMGPVGSSASAFLKAGTGDNYLFGSKPSDEALGKSALRKLLGKE